MVFLTIQLHNKREEPHPNLYVRISEHIFKTKNYPLQFNEKHSKQNPRTESETQLTVKKSETTKIILTHCTYKITYLQYK